MKPSHQINQDDWKKRYPNFDYHAAAKSLTEIPPPTRSYVYDQLYRIATTYVPDKIYKFYSLRDGDSLNENKFNTLEKGRIHLSSSKTLNDPFDCRSVYYDFEKLDLRKTAPFPNYRGAVEKFLELLPNMMHVASFTACDVQSMPMWAHYTNNHQGFCAAYDINSEGCSDLKKDLLPIQYSDQRYNISELVDEHFLLAKARILSSCDSKRRCIESIPFAIVLLMLHNIKHTSWGYEKECHLSIPSNSSRLPEIPAKPAELFIGLNCSDESAKRILSIGSNLGIPVYRMVRDSRIKMFGLAHICEN